MNGFAIKNVKFDTRFSALQYSASLFFNGTEVAICHTEPTGAGILTFMCSKEKEAAILAAWSNPQSLQSFVHEKITSAVNARR